MRVNLTGVAVPGITVRQLDALAEARWSFRGDRGPEWIHPHGFPLTGPWDPFPAYPHDYAVAAAAAVAAATVVPPLYDITLYLADREGEARTNGWSHLDKDHRSDDGSWLGVIMMSGKRIPPHPAVTRHLVAHEYGHHVEWALNLARGAASPYDTQVTTEYAAARGLPGSSLHHGEGGTWHDSVHEIFACDFRILACRVEPEYWPHPGVPRPEQVDGLRRWWAGALAEIRAAAGGPGHVTVT
jgi:hypothetical protein